jgi:hypothetical protein
MVEHGRHTPSALKTEETPVGAQNVSHGHRLSWNSLTCACFMSDFNYCLIQ